MKLYTLAEIAQELDLPESTLRYYRKALGDRLPTVGEGRQVRFREEAVAVIRKTATMVRNEGLTLQQAVEALVEAGELATEVVTARPQPQQPQQPQQQDRNEVALQPEAVVIRSLWAVEEMARAVNRRDAEVAEAVATIRETLTHLVHENAGLREAQARQEESLNAIREELTRQREAARRREAELAALGPCPLRSPTLPPAAIRRRKC